MFLLAAAFLAPISQRIGGNDALQPHTYTSPSGEWTLSVDPSARDGSGKSTVEISKQGKVQWTGEKPFTFREAVIDDSGVSAGFACTKGTERMFDGLGEFVVVIIGPSGESLFVEETPRESSDFLHASPNPRATRIVLHPERRIAVVCVPDANINAADEAWWIYGLDPAKKLGVVHARDALEQPEAHRWTIALTPVRGTPLMLAEWFLYSTRSSSGSGPGVEFAVYDEAWNLVWALPLPGDYAFEDDREGDQPFHELRKYGSILDTKLERRFEVRHVVKAERVTYEVVPDAAASVGWSVRETARAPFTGAPKEAPPAISKLKLVDAGTVALNVGAGGTAGPVRDIKGFSIDAANHITILRGEGADGAVTLVTLDPKGGVVRQVAVAPIEKDDEGSRDWFALANGDWLMTLSPYGEGDPPSRAWRVSGETGGVKQLTAFKGPSVDSIVPAPDEGFVVLGNHNYKYTSSNEVRRCAENGSELWSLTERGYDEKLSSIFSPQAVAIDARGSVFVLDGIRELVQCFDERGEFKLAIELKQAWEHEFSYLTDLIPKPDGSYLVHDFHDHTWHHIASDGKHIASFTPKRENGSIEVGDSSDVRLDAHGRLWGHDGHQLLEYDEYGIVHERFGAPADPQRLTEIQGAVLDGTGRLALGDERTHAVHLFAADGSRSVVCTPDSADFDGESSSSVDAVLTEPDGTIYVQPNSYNDSYLAFGRDGKRIGRLELGGTRVAFNLRTKERWTGGENEDDVIRLRRYDVDGKLVFETDRRPDGAFFEGIGALACGPDGSVALFGDSRLLCLYGPKGEPLRQIRVPEDARGLGPHLQMGKRWIVSSRYEPIALVVSIADGTCTVFEAADPEQDQGTWAIGLSPDEKELWALQTTPPTLHRYTLPN